MNISKIYENLWQIWKSMKINTNLKFCELLNDMVDTLYYIQLQEANPSAIGLVVPIRSFIIRYYWNSKNNR